MKPVIDVHSHIFNAKDIPLKGYLLSRKAKEGLEKLLGWVLIPWVAKCIRRKLEPKKNKMFLGGILCRLPLKLVYKLMGKQYRHWVSTMMKEVDDITAEMIKTYENDEIDLYIPLMIDYEYWFKTSSDNPIKEQIDYIADKIIIPYEGKIHPFVPFDPARELAFRKGLEDPKGKQELYGSLNLVKDAIENRGFIGVKLYNSMGYKPFNNETVEKKRKKIALHKKKYVFKGIEYDDVLSELYDYCIENDVPITAHCVMDGIESYNKASWHFGRAKFWRDVLSQKQFEKLHLNLAHFGWSKKQGYHGKKSWVREICEMLQEFEHLYTDVSHHRVVTKKYHNQFQSDYIDICRDYPAIKKKLLFGIDWHVIKRVKDFENFKTKYVKILQQDNLFNDDEIIDFLGGNALRFLGLLPGDQNYHRLKRFYQNNKIQPPQWLS